MAMKRYSTAEKGIQDNARLGGKGDPLRTVQMIKICQYKQTVYAQTRICPGK